MLKVNELKEFLGYFGLSGSGLKVRVWRGPPRREQAGRGRAAV